MDSNVLITYAVVLGELASPADYSEVFIGTKYGSKNASLVIRKTT